MTRLIDENIIIKMLNTMDRYIAEKITLCDTDKTFPKNEVFIVDDVYEGLDKLPSAQLEIIYCKDCKWCEKKCDIENKEFYYRCRNWGGTTDYNGFCHEAERRDNIIWIK